MLPPPAATRFRRAQLYAVLLLLLAVVAIWPRLWLLAQQHQQHQRHQQHSGQETQLKQPVRQDTTLYFERLHPPATEGPDSPYHAKLHVHLPASVPARTAAALKAHAPHWVVWTADDAAATADVSLQYAADCQSAQQPAQQQKQQRQQQQQHEPRVVLLQQGLEGCYEAAAGGSSSGRSFTGQAIAAWQSALLVVSPANLELQVQAMDPTLQESMHLWSMPWGADQQQLEDSKAAHGWSPHGNLFSCSGSSGPPQLDGSASNTNTSATNTSSSTSSTATTTPPAQRLNFQRFVVTFGGGPAGNDSSAFSALLAAAVSTHHTLLVLGASPAAQEVCGQTSARTARRPAQEQLCRSLCHMPQLTTAPLATAAAAEYTQLLASARYVAALHAADTWQPEVSDAVLLKRRLLVFNHTAPHQHYRWLRPFASVVEPTSNSQQLTSQLVTALSQEPRAAHEFQHKDALAVFPWSVLVPRLFDRIWSELQLARFASPAQPLIEPLLDPQPSASARQLHAAMDAVTTVCARRTDDVIQWDDVTKQIVSISPQQFLSQRNLTCPPIMLLVSGWDRSIGVCQDAAQLAAHWGHIPLLPASILAMPVTATQLQPVAPSMRRAHSSASSAAAAGDLGGSGSSLQFHEHCAGSVVLSLSVAYAELVKVMKVPGAAALHQFWYMPNYDISDSREVNTTIWLTRAADRLLTKNRAAHVTLRAYLQHNYADLPPVGQHDVMFTSFSTPDPVLSGPPATPSPALTGSGTSTATAAATAWPPAADFSRFLHLMGKSPYKNTEAILEAWSRNPDFPPLTISTYDADMTARVQQFLTDHQGLGYTPSNINLVNTRMSGEQIDQVLLGTGMHVCPSQKEGFGHYINQARAASALLLTTDYPPMREFVGDNQEYGLACPYTSLFDMEVEAFSSVNNPYLPRMDVRFFPEAIAACVRRALALSSASKAAYGRRARQRYLQEQVYFTTTLQALLQEARGHVRAHARRQIVVSTETV